MEPIISRRADACTHMAYNARTPFTPGASSLLSDAIEALTILQRFELSRDDGSRSIQALDQLAREFSALMVNIKTQTKRDSFFSEK